MPCMGCISSLDWIDSLLPTKHRFQFFSEMCSTYTVEQEVRSIVDVVDHVQYGKDQF